MKTTRKLEIEELTGTWILTTNDKSQGYTQHPQIKDYLRLVKDILRHLELDNLLEIKER